MSGLDAKTNNIFYQRKSDSFPYNTCNNDNFLLIHLNAKAYIINHSILFFLLFPITGDTMLMNDLYGFENSLSNSDSSLNNGSSVNGSCYLNGNNTGNGMNIGGNGANIGNGCTPTSIGSGTPQINANSPSIPYSPLTPSSLSSSAFATPAKNFDALQVNNYSYTYI